MGPLKNNHVEKPKLGTEMRRRMLRSAMCGTETFRVCNVEKRALRSQPYTSVRHNSQLHAFLHKMLRKHWFLEKV